MGGSRTTTQKSESAPPKWAAPLFQQSAKEAQAIYDSGAGGNVWQGETVAGLGENTQAGIGNVMNGGGNYANMMEQAAQPTSSSSNLASMASGENLLSNPFFRENLQNTLSDTASTINSSMAGAGRYGSGANTQVLGSELGKISTNAFMNQYNQDVQNQMAANSMIDNANAQSIASQLGVDQAQLGRSQAQIGAGQLEDATSQAQINSDIRRWEAEDMAPWTRLGLLQQAAAGAAGNYGTNTQQQTTPGNPLAPIGAVGSMLMK